MVSFWKGKRWFRFFLKTYKAHTICLSCLFHLSLTWFLLKFHTESNYKHLLNYFVWTVVQRLRVMHVLSSCPREAHLLSFLTVTPYYFHFPITPPAHILSTLIFSLLSSNNDQSFPSLPSLSNPHPPPMSDSPTQLIVLRGCYRDLS